MKLLEAYDWPGNVRELQSVVREALIVSAGPTVLRGVPAGRTPRPAKRRTGSGPRHRARARRGSGSLARIRQRRHRAR